jgi:hypothetical protein
MRAFSDTLDRFRPDLLAVSRTSLPMYRQADTLLLAISYVTI